MSKSKAGAKFLFKQKEALRKPTLVSPSLLKVLNRVAERVSKPFNIFNIPLEDRIQECLLKMIFNIEKIQESDNPELKAYGIARGHLIKLYNREKTFGSYSFSQLNDGVVEDADRKLATKTWLASTVNVLITALNQSMERLSEREQIILRAFYGFDDEELSIKQVAKLLNLSPDYIAELKGRSIEKLKSMLKL